MNTFRYSSGAVAAFSIAVLATVAWLNHPVNSDGTTAHKRLQLPQHDVMSQCRDCHEDVVDSFQLAPHFNTLVSGKAESVIDLFDGKEFTNGPNNYQFVRTEDGVSLQAVRTDKSLPVDWLFGAGSHARTPVCVLENADGETELMQHCLSWYPDESVKPTLGSDGETLDLTNLGTPSGHGETRECFGCHATTLVVEDGRIEFEKSQLSIQCTRCHENSEQHVADALEGEPSVSSFNSWAKLSPLDSINRCGECHRRMDHFPADELVPDNKQLARFASVGIALSDCFVNQTEQHRMDCTTCHNPHRPAESNPRFYNRICLECHQSEQPELAVCDKMPNDSDCVSCHMPRLPFQEGLEFTDHWIRIR